MTFFKYVCDCITPSERSIQRYRDEYGEYYEKLLQLTLKKASNEGFMDFNHVAIDGTIKKDTILTTIQYPKKKRKYCSNIIKELK